MKTMDDHDRIHPAGLPGGRGVVVAAALLVGCIASEAADQDLQLWFPVQVIHSIEEKWAFSMQAEIRLEDNISEFGQLVLEPGLHYHINKKWAAAAGYKYIDRGDNGPTEHDPWQTVEYIWTRNDLVMGYQVRLEERIRPDVDGILPRLRLLTHISHPIGDTPWYTTGFAAVRFNMVDKDVGPESGFEQSRIFGGIGRHIGRHTQFEFGYLWRYERQREGENDSDHVIRFRLIFNTRGKDILKPHPRDQYR